MADANTSLPVRTQSNGDVVAFLADGTTPTQLLGIDSVGRITIKLDDGAGNAVTSQANGGQRALDVGINVAGVQIDPRLAGQYSSTLPTLTNGQFTAPQTDINGRLLTVGKADIIPATQAITAQDTASTTTAQFNQSWVTGSPTAGSTASFAITTEETVLIQVSGTWTGTLVCEVSADSGVTWVSHSLHILSSPIFTSTFTGNVIGTVQVAAKTNVRIRSTATWTGTATVLIVESTNQSQVYVANPIKLVDGSSATSTTNANILPASTAASATNTSLVVALSPNSPLPAGTAIIGKVTDTNFPTTVDTNYGVVGASTIRTASQIGNATGAADFNYGTVGAQSLRVAAQIGNATGAADFNAGAIGAQTLRAAAILANATGVVDYNFGAASAQTIRVAALLGNATGVIDYNYGATSAQTIRVASQIGNATGAADFNNALPTAQTLRVAAQLAVAGANVSNTNPIPVNIVNSVPGTSINSYHTTASVAAGGTANHIYTITASKTFTGKKFWASASGKIRADIQTSPDGSTYTTFWTGFNSTSDPNISVDLDLAQIIDSGTGSTIRIVITNRDLVAFDVYSTISGVEN